MNATPSEVFDYPILDFPPLFASLWGRNFLPESQSKADLKRRTFTIVTYPPIFLDCEPEVLTLK